MTDPLPPDSPLETAARARTAALWAAHAAKVGPGATPEQHAWYAAAYEAWMAADLAWRTLKAEADSRLFGGAT